MAPVNTPLKIIKVKMNLIVNVKDCRVAIGKEIAQKIIVKINQ